VSDTGTLPYRGEPRLGRPLVGVDADRHRLGQRPQLDGHVVGQAVVPGLGRDRDVLGHAAGAASVDVVQPEDVLVLPEHLPAGHVLGVPPLTGLVEGNDRDRVALA